MGALYDDDVILWAEEQARLLRSGGFSQLDIEHLADEIEDVGKSEQRELASRMSALLAHLLKWQHQPGRRGASWKATIDIQRQRIAIALRKTPSLKRTLADADWQEDIWLDAISEAVKETGLSQSDFPETCPWPFAQVFDVAFWPGEWA